MGKAAVGAIGVLPTGNRIECDGWARQEMDSHASCGIDLEAAGKQVGRVVDYFLGHGFQRLTCPVKYR